MAELQEKSSELKETIEEAVSQVNKFQNSTSAAIDPVTGLLGNENRSTLRSSFPSRSPGTWQMNLQRPPSVSINMGNSVLYQINDVILSNQGDKFILENEMKLELKGTEKEAFKEAKYKEVEDEKMRDFKKKEERDSDMEKSKRDTEKSKVNSLEISSCGKSSGKQSRDKQPSPRPWSSPWSHGQSSNQRSCSGHRSTPQSIGRSPSHHGSRTGDQDRPYASTQRGGSPRRSMSPSRSRRSGHSMSHKPSGVTQRPVVKQSWDKPKFPQPWSSCRSRGQSSKHRGHSGNRNISQSIGRSPFHHGSRTGDQDRPYASTQRSGSPRRSMSPSRSRRSGHSMSHKPSGVTQRPDEKQSRDNPKSPGRRSTFRSWGQSSKHRSPSVHRSISQSIRRSPSHHGSHSDHHMSTSTQRRVSRKKSKSASRSGCSHLSMSHNRSRSHSKMG